MSMTEIAVVTGASSGIGEEFARQLAARGLKVLAVARRKERLRALAEASSGAIVPLALDVTADGAAEQIRDEARRLGEISWVVNNAGVDRFGTVAERSPSELTGIVRLNCESVVALTTALLPELIARKSGHLVNVASLAGFQPTPHHATYGASKAFVLSFTEALAEELRGTGVHATALCPGPVTTEIFEQLAPGVARARPPHEISAEECVRYALEAADAGRVIAIPGPRNRLMALTAQLAPRSLVRRLAAKVGMKYIGYDPEHLARS